jgi:hypothetical protein
MPLNSSHLAALVERAKLWAPPDVAPLPAPRKLSEPPKPNRPSAQVRGNGRRLDGELGHLKAIMRRPQTSAPFRDDLARRGEAVAMLAAQGV